MLKTSATKKMKLSPLVDDYPRKETRFFREAESVVGRKIEDAFIKKKRCRTCWHPKHLYCICSTVQPLEYSKNVEFIVYMHYLEYANAGDDAKLLMCCSPERTKLYLYGVEDDDVKMRNHVAEFRSRGPAEQFGVVLLFPGPKSITIDAFLEERNKTLQLLAGQDEASGCQRWPSDPSLNPLLVIVMDATWRRARRMANHFRKHISAAVPHIQLRPTTASIYARTQSQTGRICTIEALALLLQEYGERQETCDKLISYVDLNNKALTKEFKNESQILWSNTNGVGGHPAWYYGRRLDAEGDVDSIIYAARNGFLDKVKHYLNSGTSANTTNMYGWTALHKASLKGHLEIVRVLVEEGNADVNAQTVDGTSALMFSVTGNRREVAQYLLEKGADANLLTVGGKSATKFAEEKGHHECLHMLEESLSESASR